MKSLILAGAVILGLGATRTVINSPQLLSVKLWEKVPSIKWLGRLTDQEIEEMNGKYGLKSSQFPKDTVKAHVQNAEEAAGPAALAKCSLVRVVDEEKEVGEPDSLSTDTGSDTQDDDADPASPPGKVSRKVRVIISENGHHGNHLFALAQAPEAAPGSPADPVVPPEPPSPDIAPVPAAAPRSPRPPGRVAQYVRTQQTSPFYMAFGNPGGEGTSLVIRSSETDPKNLSAVEEDLNVMSRILAKAAEARENSPEKAMGIRLSSFGEGVKNLHIDGYGDIFLLKVNFPLSGPPDETATTEAKEPANSTWEQAKRELYGPHGGGSPFEEWQTETVNKPRESYNPKRVERLKDSLLEALKNAANIRSLKDDDVVTVVVTSGEAGHNTFVNKAMVEAGLTVARGGEVEHGKPANHQKSTLTLRAKKSDIDAFAHEKTNLDAFRKKVAIALY
jgi:hypothetical protein